MIISLWPILNPLSISADFELSLQNSVYLVVIFRKYNVDAEFDFSARKIVSFAFVGSDGL
ncbi:hypothetical protein HZS_5023 [Henneguya salminicola]|nr:hypothetical protein HZS_5023 [Henneguya salminicola]